MTTISMVEQGILLILEQEDVTPTTHFEGSTHIAFYSNGYRLSIWDSAFTPFEAQDMGRYYEFNTQLIPKGATGVMDI